MILPKADLTSYTWISGSIYLPTISLDLCVHVKLLQLCPTLCDVTDVPYQAPPSMGFSRQEYWSGLPLPPPGELPDPGIKPRSPALQADYLPSVPQVRDGILIGIFQDASKFQTLRQ